jgi:class 3 adenylate cyclase/HAMP domain-containing protein
MNPAKREAWRVGLLPLGVLVANLFALGLLYAYTQLNLRPFLPVHETVKIFGQPLVALVAFLFLLPAAVSLIFLRPVFLWLGRGESDAGAPLRVVQRAAKAPITLAMLTAAAWALVGAITLLRFHVTVSELTLGLWAHFFVRPVLTGLIAATGIYFVTEFICRWQVWPVVFAGRTITGDQGVWRIRLLHRLIMFWATVSFLPLGAVALIAYARLEALGPSADPVHSRIMYAIILIGFSAALGGACLAWVISRTMVNPLGLLEKAMERVRGGDFSIRVVVGSTDEIGSLESGFNEMTQRIAESYETLEARNRELAGALDQVAYLEAVKRGLDRFVPDTVRRLIEENPQSPALQKTTKDVTVLLLDIQGYTVLSEELPAALLNEIIENYFSMYLSDIRAAGGDINETAGDGLMIIFQDEAASAHAASAVRVALAIREKTGERNLVEKGRHPPVVVNMGVSSGECEVGSTRLRGAAGERWTFTASGPVTNLAARLGNYAKDGQILASPETAGRVRGQFRVESRGSVQLKNISHAVEVWEIEDTIRRESRNVEAGVRG